MSVKRELERWAAAQMANVTDPAQLARYIRRILRGVDTYKLEALGGAGFSGEQREARPGIKETFESSIIYMDSGAFAPPAPGDYATYTYPVVIHMGDAVLSHLAAGYTFDETDYILLPSTADNATWSGSTPVFGWAFLDASPDIGGPPIPAPPTDAYNSPVFTQATASKFYAVGSTSNPPWRYSGLMRLAAQAKNGIGELVDTLYGGTINPDTDGIIHSTDYRFFHVRIVDDDVTYTELTPGNGRYLVEHLIAEGGTMTEEEREWILAHVFSQLIPTPNTYTETAVTDLDQVWSDGKVPFAYGWHWCYDDSNVCSIVTYRHADPSGWAGTLKYHLTTLASISFAVPTESGWPSATVSVEEDEQPFQNDDTDLWWYADDPDLCAFLPPVGESPTLRGSSVAVDCFYNKNGRNVLRYSAPTLNSVPALDDPSLAYLCGPGAVSEEVQTSAHTASESSWVLDGSTGAAKKSVPTANVTRRYDSLTVTSGGGTVPESCWGTSTRAVIQGQIDTRSCDPYTIKIETPDYPSTRTIKAGGQLGDASYNRRSVTTSNHGGVIAAAQVLGNPDAMYLLASETMTITGNDFLYGFGSAQFLAVPQFFETSGEDATPELQWRFRGAQANLSVGGPCYLLTTTINTLDSTTAVNETQTTYTGQFVSVTGGGDLDVAGTDLTGLLAASRASPCEGGILQVQESWSGAIKYTVDTNLYHMTGGYGGLPAEYTTTSISWYQRPHFVGKA